MSSFKEQVLEYHSKTPKGKIALRVTKQVNDQCDLSLAYTPGVAFACKEIEENKEKIWEYTLKGNSVAVLTDGTAVLGLGNIGVEASLPVMEGKAMLFKRFADIDAYPICVEKKDVENLIDIAKRIKTTFGGINLEDIKGPECFEVEERLKKEMDIPVFHDDQHGTAIIVLAGLKSAMKLTGKKLGNIKLVINGAGAAGIACARYLRNAGVNNIVMCDSKGVIYRGRADINKYKEDFAIDTEARNLNDAIKGADVFLGVSAAGILKKEMIQSMNSKPVIFALANPTPEIMPQEAYDAGAFIVATGRSDYPNQVNNVMGFPGIFRAALDTRAKEINEEMKKAASEALAEVTEMRIDDKLKSFLGELYVFDKELFEPENPLSNRYIIPKPFDPRVVPRVARKVAEAAIRTKVARVHINDLDKYENELKERLKFHKL